jgi:4-hydroxybenzoate polyprenyltransferase
METIQSRTGQGRVADAPSGHWVYRALPRSMWPYAQLARWDRPIGWWLLLWPCWWSTALAATAFARPGDPLLTLLPSPLTLLLFLVGSVAMRGAGCTYNDIVDERIDAEVERTRSRPLPSGQVTRRQAWIFLVAQALVGLAVLLQFNGFAVVLGLCSIAVVAVYPFMKRITNWPQLVLGLAFSWGALMGWAVEFGDLDGPAIMLYLGSILWVIGYDTIYAHQDKEDDAIVHCPAFRRKHQDLAYRPLRLCADVLRCRLRRGGSADASAGRPRRRRRAYGASDLRARYRQSDAMPEAVPFEQGRRLADLPRARRRRRLDGAEAAAINRRAR